MGYVPVEQTVMLVNAVSRAIAENQPPPENHWIKLVSGLILAAFTILLGRYIKNKGKKNATSR